MRTTPNECGHCGIEYSFYWSGQNIPTHNSDIYCTECEEARSEAVKKAFGKIPVLFKNEYIITDEVNLDTLLRLEKENFDELERKNKEMVKEKGNPYFPLMRRVYASLYDSKTGETSKSGGVSYNDRSYSYFYWPSKPEEAKIKVLERINVKTGEPVVKIF